MKKIIMMAKALGGGGAEVAMIELLNQLDYSKYQVKLVLLDDDEEYRYRLKHDVDIEHIKFKTENAKKKASMYSLEAKIIKKLSLNKYFNIYDSIFDSVENIFDDDYDIALDFYGYGYFLTAFMAKRIKASKKATWIHDEKMLWMNNVARYLSEYDKVFAVSKAVENQFKNKFPEYSNKSEVFYNVIDVDSIIEKSHESLAGEFEGKFNILTVGRFTEQKGYDIAVKSAEILKNRNIEFNWYAIGDGRDYNKIKKMITLFGLDDYFYLLGRKDNPYPYISACDLYVQPSRHEGYGLAILEARILGKLTVATSLPCIKEQIIDSVNGFLVELDSKELADKIEFIIKNPDIAELTRQAVISEKIDFSDEIKKIDF